MYSSFFNFYRFQRQRLRTFVSGNQEPRQPAHPRHQGQRAGGWNISDSPSVLFIERTPGLGFALKSNRRLYFLR